MRRLLFSVDGQHLAKQGDFSGITAGSKGYLKCCFGVDSSDWRGAKKVALFNETCAVAVDEALECDVPDEVTSGTVFTNITGRLSPFSVERYRAVPKDADYITLMFGLNECEPDTNQGFDPAAIIGKKTDTANTTVWDAYNIVFEYFMKNIPYAKLGVILADTSTKAQQLRNDAFTLTARNTHPGLRGREYRSTIIENWMRGL